MKKLSARVLSLVLVLVLVCSMLPVGAMAASSSVPLTLNIRSYGAPFMDGNGNHNVGSIRWTKYIKRSDVGSDNADGIARAYFTKEGDNYWLTLDVEIGNYKETITKVYNAKISNKDMSVAGGEVTFGFSFNASNGVSTYISISGGRDLPIEEPTDAVVKGLLDVKVDDTTNKHDDATYELEAGTYTIGKVNQSTKKCVVTLTNPGYYVTTYGNEHTRTNTGDVTEITLSYSGSGWTASASQFLVNVECEEEEEPTPDLEKPTDDVVKGLLKVKVNDTTDRHADETYDLAAGTYTIGEVDQDAKTCVVTLSNPGHYVTAYGNEHTRTNSGDVTEITMTYSANGWAASASQFLINVECEEEKPEGETWTIKLRILEISDDYNLGYSIVAGETTRTIPVDTNVNQFNVNTPSFNTVASEIGYSLKTDYGFKGITWDQTADKNSLINIPQTDVTATFSNVYVTSNGYTIWYVVEKAETEPDPTDPTEPAAPNKPTEDEVKSRIGVMIECIRTGADKHETATYALADGTFEIAEVTKSGDSYITAVTVYAEEYVELYSKQTGVEHELAPTNPDGVLEVPLYYNNGWLIGSPDAASAQEAEHHAAFEVICKNSGEGDKDDDDKDDEDDTPVWFDGLDDVPKTGDPTMTVLGGFGAMAALLGALAVLLSKKRSVR